MHANVSKTENLKYRNDFGNYLRYMQYERDISKFSDGNFSDIKLWDTLIDSYRIFRVLYKYISLQFSDIKIFEGFVRKVNRPKNLELNVYHSYKVIFSSHSFKSRLRFMHLPKSYKRKSSIRAFTL